MKNETDKDFSYLPLLLTPEVFKILSFTFNFSFISQSPCSRKEVTCSCHRDFLWCTSILQQSSTYNLYFPIVLWEREESTLISQFPVGKTALESEEIYEVSVQELCKKQEWILHYLRPSWTAQPEDYSHLRLHIHTRDHRCLLTGHNFTSLGVPTKGKIPQEYPLGSTMSGRSTAVPSISHTGGFAEKVLIPKPDPQLSRSVCTAQESQAWTYCPSQSLLFTQSLACSGGYSHQRG